MSDQADVSWPSDQTHGSENSGNLNYYCYECSAHVTLEARTNLKCPTCQGTFLEEITDDNREEMVNDASTVGQDPTNNSAVFNDLNDFLSAFFANFPDVAPSQDPGTRQGNLTNRNEDTSNNTPNGASSSAPIEVHLAPLSASGANPESRERGNRSVHRSGRSRDRHALRSPLSQPYSRVFDSEDDLTTLNSPGASGIRLNLGDELLHGLIDNLIAQNRSPLVLNGNPNDYAWGPGGLDAILTQMMDQLEGCGPPPCRRETIDAIPSITITADHVKAEADCSVCQDRYEDKEKASCLPCMHLFHKECIEPWLQLHNACPVCRKPIEGADDGGNSGGVGGNNGVPSSSSRTTPRRGAANRRRSNSQEEPDPSFFRNTNAYG